jgi:hypothetical protein
MGLDGLKKLLAEATPGWCGAMVAAMAIRAGSAKLRGDAAEEEADFKLAVNFANQMPSLKASLPALIERVERLEEALDLAARELEAQANDPEAEFAIKAAQRARSILSSTSSSDNGASHG